MDWKDRAARNVAYVVPLPGGQRRLKEAILYVCQKSEDMPRFGAIKLNKILWRADFRSFYERRIPVTGRQYQRLELGPAPVEMPPLIAEMLRDNLLEIESRGAGQFMERRHKALSEPVLKFFSPDDLDYIDESIWHYWNMTGTESSDLSHGIAWKTRYNGDPMPYQSALFEDAPLPPEGLKHFAAMGERLGWRSA